VSGYIKGKGSALHFRAFQNTHDHDTAVCNICPNGKLEKAGLQLLGLCLIRQDFARHIPPSIPLGRVGGVIVDGVKLGMGLEAIADNLEAIGLDNAYKHLQHMLSLVPDDAGFNALYWRVVRMLVEAEGI